jgi:hypothetical protein
MLSREAANINFRQRLEPTIYHTGGEYVNHYTTDAVACITNNKIHNNQVAYF